MQYPLTAVVGQSGSGKSTSMRNLPPQETCILNIERKLLPFPEAKKFVHTERPSTVDLFENQLKKALKDDSYSYIVIESFTKYVERLIDKSRAINKGYDIYSWYNKKIADFFELIKNNDNKFVFVIAIDDMIEVNGPTGSNTTVRRIGVQGKEWFGKIEKEFPVVLFTDVREEEKTGEMQYRFVTKTDGITSCKTPRDMFKNLYVDNCLFNVSKIMTDYWGLAKDSEGGDEII